MSPSLTAGSLLGAQTDHLHIETSDSMNTWKFSHLDPTPPAYTRSTLHPSGDRNRHGQTNILCRDRPMPHKNHKWPPPWQVQLCLSQNVLCNSLQIWPCIFVYHTEHTQVASVRMNKSSKMLCSSAFVCIDHTPSENYLVVAPAISRHFSILFVFPVVSPPFFAVRSFSSACWRSRSQLTDAMCCQSYFLLYRSDLFYLE